MLVSEQTAGGGGVSSPPARWVRVAAQAVILCLALILLGNILSSDGVRMWPDQGFPLLVVALTVLTATPALLRALSMRNATFGENLVDTLNRDGRVRLLVFGGIWLGFALALPWAGFLLCATLAMAVSMTAIARTRVWVALPICAIIALLVFIAFQKVLYVGLPLGPIDLLVINNLLEG